jgi:hypothetical protein
MAQRKNVKKTEEKMQYLTLPDFGTDDDEGAYDASKAKTGEKDTAAEIAELRAKLAELDRYKADAERLQSANLALMSAPVVQAQPQMLPTEPDMKNLPDPTEQPQQYATEVAKRTAVAIQNAQKNSQVVTDTQQSAQQKLNALWTDFNAEYSEYAKNPNLVKFAAQEVASQAAQRGMDVNRYMFANSKGFMADVAKYIEKNFAPQKTEEEDDDEADDVRTVGMFGGAEGKGRVTQQQEEGPGDAFADIRDFQRRTGWHR